MAEKFARPEVRDETIATLRDIARSRGATEPWTLLDLATDEGIEKSDARKALRTLKMANEIVPAGDFSGEVRLVED
jgi:hypothetical protein